MQQTEENTKVLRLLRIVFDLQLQPWELGKFRGAISDKVGLEHDWYHNHQVDGGVLHRYPLIQYKLHRQQPMLLYLGSGVEEAKHFFDKPDWTLRIGNQVHDMRIQNMELEQHRLMTLEDKATYRLHNWIALNPQNFERYQETESLGQRILLLEHILKGHLWGFCEGVDWQPEVDIEVSILNVFSDKYVSYRGVKVLSFKLDFKCNLSLPDFVALGKGTTVGFGVLRRQ